MNTSTFRTNLKTALDALSAYTTLGADVHKYPPGKAAKMVPTVIVAEVTANRDDLTLLATQFTNYTVTGGGYAPGAGAADAGWATAESNANTLMAGLGSALIADQTVGGICTKARLESYTVTPTTDDQGRVIMDIAWSVSVQAVE